MTLKEKLIRLNTSIDKPSYVETVLFFKHLSLMIKSGISVYQGLEIIASQTTSKSLKRVLKKIVQDIANGETLSMAMSRFPRVFNEFHLSLVSVGEDSGTLDDNFNYLAEYLTKDYKLRKKIHTALFYPMVIFVAMIDIGAFITIFVLPKITDFFKTYKKELPLATKLLLNFSKLIQERGFLLLGGLILFFVVVSYIYKLKALRGIRDKYILKIPIMGNFIAKKQLVSLTRNFGVLIRSGVPIVIALDITSRALTNKKFAMDVKSISESVRRGGGIGVAIESIKDTPIPPMLTKMLEIGDKTGSLSDVSIYLSDFYEDELDNIAANLSSSLEPLLLVLMGIMVGYVAIAILTPIYSITDTIGGP